MPVNSTLLMALLVPASAFVVQQPHLASASSHAAANTRLSTHSPTLLSDLMRIEWVEQQVQELKDLEASIFGGGTSAKSSQQQQQAPVNDVSLQMDYDLAEAISEPRVDPAELQAKLQARLQRNKQQQQVVDASLQMDYDLADAISEPRIDPAELQKKLQERLKQAKKQQSKAKQAEASSSPLPIDAVSLQMDYDLADAISEPRIDQAELQKKLRARLAEAQKRKAQKQEPALLSSNPSRRTVVKVVP